MKKEVSIENWFLYCDVIIDNINWIIKRWKNFLMNVCKFYDGLFKCML